MSAKVGKRSNTATALQKSKVVAFESIRVLAAGLRDEDYEEDLDLNQHRMPKSGPEVDELFRRASADEREILAALLCSGDIQNALGAAFEIGVRCGGKGLVVSRAWIAEGRARRACRTKTPKREGGRKPKVTDDDLRSAYERLASETCPLRELNKKTGKTTLVSNERRWDFKGRTSSGVLEMAKTFNLSTKQIVRRIAPWLGHNH